MFFYWQATNITFARSSESDKNNQNNNNSNDPSHRNFSF